jgi:hypothetical protein
VPRKNSTPENPRFKPFHRSREVKSECLIENEMFSIYTRVTAKKNGSWYFWFVASRVTSENSVSEGVRRSPLCQKEPWKTIENALSQKLD